MKKFRIHLTFVLPFIIMLASISCNDEVNERIKKGFENCRNTNAVFKGLLTTYKTPIPTLRDYEINISNSRQPRLNRENLELCMKQKKIYTRALKKHKISIPQKESKSLTKELCGSCSDELSECQAKLQKYMGQRDKKSHTSDRIASSPTSKSTKIPPPLPAVTVPPGSPSTRYTAEKRATKNLEKKKVVIQNETVPVQTPKQVKIITPTTPVTLPTTKMGAHFIRMPVIPSTDLPMRVKKLPLGAFPIYASSCNTSPPTIQTVVCDINFKCVYVLVSLEPGCSRNCNSYKNMLFRYLSKDGLTCLWTDLAIPILAESPDSKK